MDLISFFGTAVLFFTAGYFMFDFMIRKLNIPTPGRAGNDIEMAEAQPSVKLGEAKGELACHIISLLGGKDNIVDIDACMTRLRVTVKDTSIVAEHKEWKSTDALGVIIKDNGVQVIYGPKVDTIKSNVLDALSC